MFNLTTYFKVGFSHLPILFSKANDSTPRQL